MSYFKATNPENDYFSKHNFIAADLKENCLLLIWVPIILIISLLFLQMNIFIT